MRLFKEYYARIDDKTVSVDGKDVQVGPIEAFTFCHNGLWYVTESDTGLHLSMERGTRQEAEKAARETLRGLTAGQLQQIIEKRKSEIT